jgi:glycosyltransferase involved in cell wall biosynthesis
MKVAITYDWLNSFGGGERVLLELHRLFPEAPVYTTVHDPRRLAAGLRDMDVRTSFLQHIPFARRHHRPFLPLMPMAFERFDMRGYDLVLTTNSACAKGVITGPETVNFCYCFTPCRYVWDLYHEYTASLRSRILFAPIAHWLRVWDRVAADRVDHFAAISGEVAARIRKHYRREAEVIFPPVDVERIRPSEEDPEDLYLVVSRLVPYKRIDLAIQAANRLRCRLIIVGDGPDLRRLQGLAGPTVEFKGWLPDEEVAKLYRRCKAFLFPGYEDFGIAPVEAQAAGRPVIAYARGGATETVIDGETGVLFGEQSVDALVEAMLKLSAFTFDPGVCRRNAERFGADVFRGRLLSSIHERLEGTPVPAVASGRGGRSSPLERSSAT